MTTTFELIASTSLSTSSAQVDFTSIPATYDDLLIKISAKGGQAGDNQNTNIIFNSATTTFAYKSLYSFGTSVNADGSANYSLIGFANSSGSSVTNLFSNQEIYIPNYTSTSPKSFYVDSVSEKNSSSVPYIGLISIAGGWNGTSAISSIGLKPDAVGWLAYSTFYLYGIKNS